MDFFYSLIIINMFLCLFETRKKLLSFRDTKKGFSLIEALVVIFLFSILSGIAVISYRTYTTRITLKTIRNVSEAFPHVIKTCVTASGWKITRPDGTTVYPCNDLDKIDYLCPVTAEDYAGCTPCSFWPDSATPPSN